MTKACGHEMVCTDCTPHAIDAGFKRPPLPKRLAAVSASGRIPKDRRLPIPERVISNELCFPGPLVLPGDALALDTEEPPQSTKSWAMWNNKNKAVTLERNTIYVVPPPEVSKDTKTSMRNWGKPLVPDEFKDPGLPTTLSSPKVDDVCDYLRAFYHGLKVKEFEPKFQWQAWDPYVPKSTEGYIGLATPAPSEELVGIRCRPSPDAVARKQLNLNDILDAIIDRVPSDAFAIVMLVNQDLYEDEDDDFCCGRAYGASRIAVVSSFRYHPWLDQYSDIDRAHMWPASHCKEYTQAMCSAEDGGFQGGRSRVKPGLATEPLLAAIEASRHALELETAEGLSGLWFSRVARTLSHELGHCLGLDHCVYYACVMQGTASVSEDVRQPPYLCPVCLSKLSVALCRFVEPELALSMRGVYIEERYEVLRGFSDNWKPVGMFAAYAAWLEKLQENRIGLSASKGLCIVPKREHAPKPRDFRSLWKSPFKGLASCIHQPLNHLAEGTFLHGRPEGDTYRILIEAYRIYRREIPAFQNETDSNGVRIPLFMPVARRLTAFQVFLDKAKERGLLPPWWTDQKLDKCIYLSSDASPDNWYSLDREVSQDDILSRYGPTFYYELRIFYAAVIDDRTSESLLRKLRSATHFKGDGQDGQDGQDEEDAKDGKDGEDGEG